MQATQLDTAQCDMCEATDTSVAYHHPDVDSNWFPVLACNSFATDFTISSHWNGKEMVVDCDGVNHALIPFGATDEERYTPEGHCLPDCYWWYQGNYPNGWVYFMGDWRCGPCAEKTIFGHST